MRSMSELPEGVGTAWPRCRQIETPPRSANESRGRRCDSRYGKSPALSTAGALLAPRHRALAPPATKLSAPRIPPPPCAPSSRPAYSPGGTPLRITARRKQEEGRMATATQPQTRYRLKLKQIEACNCNHGCGCQFSGFPDNGNCEFVIGWEVDEGKFGNVALAGLRFAVACKY